MLSCLHSAQLTYSVRKDQRSMLVRKRRQGCRAGSKDGTNHEYHELTEGVCSSSETCRLDELTEDSLFNLRQRDR